MAHPPQSMRRDNLSKVEIEAELGKITHKVVHHHVKNADINLAV